MNARIDRHGVSRYSRGARIICLTADNYKPQRVMDCIAENICDDPAIRAGIKNCLRQRRMNERARRRAR